LVFFKALFKNSVTLQNKQGMKALIIDDEHKARKLLSTLLTTNCPEIDHILDAENLLDGVALIREHKPKIVFLDIEMPTHSGLEIGNFFEGEDLDFKIIFITAYNQYAVEAFKLSAVDYLLKPVDTIELKGAVEKALDAIHKGDFNQSIDKLKKSFQDLTRRKLALEVPRGILFIDHDDVLYFEADGMYTRVFLEGNAQELIAKPLKFFVEQLNGVSSFYKPHRSYLININNVSEFNKKDGGYLVMKNQKKVSISRDNKEAFFKVLGQMMH